jgi:hypothetical protein
MKNKKTSKGKVVAGVATVAAIGAGAYYMLGPNGKKNQKKAKVLAGKIKKEVAKDSKKLKKEVDVFSKMVKRAVSDFKKKK